jgi:hypothetical protein
MSNISNLEINQEVYNNTKDIIIQNGSPLWEHSKGSRVTLYSSGIMCATTSPGNYLILNKGITKQQFTSFLAIFKKTLLMQFKKNEALFDLKITYDGVSREKNYEVWNKMPIGMDFYTIDLNSAYWQMAHKLGYITKPMFTKYVDDNTYKEAKRYCISFLSRQEYMTYHDGREINKIHCNVDCFIQVYDNIRNSLYQSINDARLKVNDWIDYNIDAVAVKKEDVHIVANAFDTMQLFYKIKKCIKTGDFEYVNDKGVIRKF